MGMREWAYKDGCTARRRQRRVRAFPYIVWIAIVGRRGCVDTWAVSMIWGRGDIRRERKGESSQLTPSSSPGAGVDEKGQQPPRAPVDNRRESGLWSEL